MNLKEIVVLTGNRDTTPTFFTDRHAAVTELRKHYDYCAHQDHTIPLIKAAESQFVEGVNQILTYREGDHTFGATGVWTLTAWAIPQAL